jgi:hypothetical protein
VISRAEVARPTDVVINNVYAYLAGGGVNGLAIVDISHFGKFPSYHPGQTFLRLEGKAPGMACSFCGSGGGEVSKLPIAVAGNYAYVGGGGVTVLDISDPHNIRRISDQPQYQEKWGIGEIWDLFLAGNRAYAATSDGISIFDISSPGQMVELARDDSMGFTKGIAVEGQYAYVNSLGYGLKVIDVTDPTNLLEVGNYPIPGVGWDVKVKDGRVYVSWNYDGLLAIDLNKRNRGVEIFAIGLRGQLIHQGDYLIKYAEVYGMAIDGRYAYIAAGMKGLRVVDISDPDQPGEIGYFETPTEASAVVVDGKLVYMVDNRGLWILRFIPPSR